MSELYANFIGGPFDGMRKRIDAISREITLAIPVRSIHTSRIFETSSVGMEQVHYERASAEIKDGRKSHVVYAIVQQEDS